MENREKLTVMRRVRPEEKERVLTLVSDVFESSKASRGHG